MKQELKDLKIQDKINKRLLMKHLDTQFVTDSAPLKAKAASSDWLVLNDLDFETIK